MYASFLLKYSKSYLHTCIIFYMFILFFFLQCHTRGRVISLSRIGIHPHPPPTLLTRFCFSKRFVTLAPFSPSFSLSIGDFYLSLVLLGTDHRWWTQWGTPARPGSEKEKKMKKKKKKKGASQTSGNWHVRLRVYMYVRVRMLGMRVHLGVCV